MIRKMRHERMPERPYSDLYQKACSSGNWETGTEDFDRTAFGIRIQETRLKLGMTQEELAAAIGMEQNNLSRIERGVRACSLSNLVKLSGTLCVPADYLLTGNTDASGSRHMVIGFIEKKLMEIKEIYPIGLTK